MFCKCISESASTGYRIPNIRKFLRKYFIRCLSGKNIETYKEKKTDVNIVTFMLTDAFQNKCNKALLISGDRDLSPPINILQSNFQNHKVVIAFPPARKSKHLQKIVTASLSIKEKHLISCQFPNSIKTESGYVLKKPDRWS